jgi:hypothetical protein
VDETVTVAQVATASESVLPVRVQEVASPLVVYEPVEFFSAVVVEREP